jgi:hypothetical protein
MHTLPHTHTHIRNTYTCSYTHTHTHKHVSSTNKKESKGGLRRGITRKQRGKSRLQGEIGGGGGGRKEEKGKRA